MKLSTVKLTSAPFISLKTTPLKEIGEAWLWMSSCSRRHPSCLYKTHLFNKYSATSGIKVCVGKFNNYYCKAQKLAGVQFSDMVPCALKVVGAAPVTCFDSSHS